MSTNTSAEEIPALRQAKVAEYLSRINRASHEERRKHETRFFISALAVMVLSVWAVLEKPIPLTARIIVAVGLVVMAGTVASYLRGTHRANSVNMRIAEDAEDWLMKRLTVPVAVEMASWPRRTLRSVNYSWYHQAGLLGLFAMLAGAIIVAKG